MHHILEGSLKVTHWVLLSDINVPLMFLMCEDSLSCPLIIHNYCFICACMLSKPAFFNLFLLQTPIAYGRCTCITRYCSYFELLLKSLGKYC
jgi:hypothetical protein